MSGNSSSSIHCHCYSINYRFHLLVVVEGEREGPDGTLCARGTAEGGTGREGVGGAVPLGSVGRV